MGEATRRRSRQKANGYPALRIWRRVYRVLCYDGDEIIARNVRHADILSPQAPLKDEARILLDSTLSNKPVYYKVLAELGPRKAGYSRQELVAAVGVKDGQGFTAVLSGLEECGYIRRYENPYRKGRKAMFQLVDPFLLFSMKFIGEKRSVSNWLSYYDTPSHNAWRGNAFEIVCACHGAQLRRALSLDAMETRSFPWSSSSSDPGAQVDLVIERPDKITYLCEMKFTNEPFSVSKSFSAELERKRIVFKDETSTRNSVQVVIIAAAGMKQGVNAGIVSVAVSGDELFHF